MKLEKLQSQDDLIQIFYRLGGLARAIGLVLNDGKTDPDITFAVSQMAQMIDDISGFLTDSAEVGGISVVSGGDAE